MKPTVEELIEKSKNWREELTKLRSIVLSCGLTEEVKWYQPCYSFNGTNLIILGSFKEYCGMNFFKGVLLKDEKKILQKIGENTQSAKIVKFTNIQQINDLESTLKDYIKEMIELEKSGAKVTFKKIEEQKLPEELEEMFNQDKDFENAFKALTPGRQRAYLLHFSSAKQSSTRIARIEKAKPQIFAGKGLNE
jgi:uncharacterized protein YdeI (YjbR/CyaY-like superfamily)